MPTEVYTAILVASGCIVIMTVCLTAVSIYLTGRVRDAEKEFNALSGEIRDFVHEGRTVLARTNEVVGRVNDQMDDVAHITHTARTWVARTDSMVDTLGKAAESPLFLFSKYSRNVRAFASGVFQSLKSNHRHP